MGSRTTAAALAAASLILGSAAATPGGSARAASVEQRKRSVDREIAQMRDALEGTESSLVEAVVDLRRVQAELGEARIRLRRAERERAAAQRRDDELASRLAVAKATVAKAEAELAERARREQQTRLTLGTIAREAYVSYGPAGLSVALDATSPEEFGQRLAVSATALRIQLEAIERLEVQQAEADARRAKLTALRAEVAELKRRAVITLRERRAAERAAELEAQRVSGLMRRQRRAVLVIRSKRAAEKARLADLARTQHHLRAVLARRAAEAARRKGLALGGSRSGSGVLSYPAAGPVTSPFGWRIHPIFRTRRLHTGTDIGTGCGAPIRAAAGGRVLLAGWAGGYGNRVVVDHGVVRGVGLATTYNHMSRILRSGGSVRRGELLGRSGTTGASTGCHLHFEVLVNGSFTDPMGWL